MTRTLEENYYELAEINWLIKTGQISQPAVIHNKPELFNLTEEKAVKIRLNRLRQQIKTLKDEYSAVKCQYLQGKREFAYITLNSLQGKIDKIEKNIHFLKARLRGDIVNQPFDLEALKKVPISSITKINANNFFQVNPFRQEKEPSNSLFYYKAQNRAQDFATSKSYDAIDVYMAVNQCDFKTACKEMQSL
jgi:hypothetical protein